MDYSIAFPSLSIFVILLMIAIACLRFTMRRVSPDHSSVDGYSDMTDIFRYDLKCSLTSFKRRRKKKCISKLEKKKNIFSAHYKLHLRTLTLILRLLSLIRKGKKKHAPGTRTLLSSVPENDFWNLCRYLRYSLLQIPLFYTHDLQYLSSILSHSPVLSFTLAFSISTRSIYLSTISLLYILAPAIQCFMVFTLCTFLSAGPWRKRVGDADPIKKIIT